MEHAAYDASQKVWVGNVPFEASSEDLDTHFRQLGEPLVCEMVRKGVGVIVYATPEEAETATSAFNASEIGGASIETAPWAAKKGAGKGGGGGGNKNNKEKHKANGKGGGKKAAPSSYGAGGGGKAAGGFAWGAGFGAAGRGAYGQAGAMGKGGAKGGWGAGGQKVICHRIAVDETSTIVQQGLTGEAPAVTYEKGKDVFGSSAHILGDLVGDGMDQIAITHDPDWENFPEVAEAVKLASRQEDCIAVASYAPAGVWGVGVGSGWKGREAAVKIALALAIVETNPAVLQALKKNYPEFVTLARQQGVGKGGAAGAGVAGGIGGGDGAWGGGATAGSPGGGAAAAGEDTPPFHVLTLPADCALVQQGLSAEVPAVMHSGKAVKHFFSSAHSILCEFIEDPAEDVAFDEDSEGQLFPEIHEAWKTAGSEEAGCCIARSQSLGVWGVGMAWGKKNRESAAKLALAVAIATATGKLEEIAANPDYPEFCTLLAAAGLVEQPKPKKRRKGGW